MTYAFQVTLKNLFSDVIPIIDETHKEALRTYSKDTYYTIINRLSRNTTPLSQLLHRLGTYVDIRSTFKQQGKVASAQYIPFYIYTEGVATAEKTLPILKELFQQNSIKFPTRISLYRSIDNNYKKALGITESESGKNKEMTHVYQDKAFTSTSISLDFVLGFKKETGFKTKLYLLPEIEYSLIPLTKGLTTHEHEKEVLLNTGCVYFYIGQSLYETNLPGVTEISQIYEYILLPDMETYNQIGKEKLQLIGKGIHEDYIDILKHTKEIPDLNKAKYIAELEYLLQYVTRPQPNDTELLSLSEQEIKDRYRYFVENLKLLQKTLFDTVFPNSILTQDNIERKINKQRREIYILREYKNTELHNMQRKVIEEFNESIYGGGAGDHAASNRFQFYKKYLRSK